MQEALINNNPTADTPAVKKGGRPTLYKPEYDDKAYKLCLLGATDKDMADFFEVDERTINEWKVKHKTFSQSITRGKIEADTTAAHSLYKLATGYEHPEDVIMQYQGQPVIVPTIKRYPPDYKALSLWLRNRQPDKWREVQGVDVRHDITIHPGELLPMADVMRRLREVAPAVDADFEPVSRAIAHAITKLDDAAPECPHDS